MTVELVSDIALNTSHKYNCAIDELAHYYIVEFFEMHSTYAYVKPQSRGNQTLVVPAAIFFHFNAAQKLSVRRYPSAKVRRERHASHP